VRFKNVNMPQHVRHTRYTRRFWNAGELIVVTLLASAGCFVHHSEELPAPLRSAVRDSLLALDMARGDLVARQGYGTAAASWLDSAVVYLRAGAPIVYGRTEALTLLADGSPERATYQWRPLGGGVSRDSSGGYTYGVATIATPNADGPPAVRSDRYIAFWRRGADRGWRVIAYADVGAPPLSTTATVPSAELPPTLALPRGRRAAAVREVRQADSAFALAADLQGTGVAFAQYVAPQGVVFSGPEIVIGTDAVRALFEEQQRAGGTLNWRPVYADATESGDLGFTVGEYVFTGRGATGTVVQRFGKYLTIWMKQPGGEWRFVVDGGNTSPTPTR
jgi:ketosteroid isomerase-like protein